MFGSDLYVALVLGVTLSLIFSEKTGVVPAGLIVPGYLALVFDQWQIMLVIITISVVTYLIVTHGISRWVILYGRRKFAAMMITGICLKLLLDFVYPVMPFEIFEFRGIGIIVPGLIANTIQRQGMPLTLGSTLLLSGLTFGLMNVYYLF
ncbi:poly-gamma-glutamate biosynthesis protein PgsC [Peribacillus butanolivorans]|uniref:poly-gamma-glutamate biosynthesis protein PgsC n=1 Tax=Peribacillus butanolivorans TaxID=421767 RepID=UPI00070A83E8|nr:poly-gamma-glutamate biosynthesis protein PgsC [Peribacillus butanolivorans]KRF67498.1 poly-gamma-glutamate biosynthesis protein PgsC [Bacillus sp. Soil768D1]MED3687467.1 poly-gamma-glutamate biosynthesis protein PgsC [Peribacillus butanolivorans]QNU03534.1 poly-gamma-glutamate biosynthesis protein PgsC [Peribacillus butanolivorans]